MGSALNPLDPQARECSHFDHFCDGALSQDLAQIEIPHHVLARLLREGSVFAAELQSLNRQSRLVIRDAIKSCLM